MSKTLRLFALAAIATIVAVPRAHAVVFDTVTGVMMVAGSGPTDGGPTTLMGASFTASPGSFSQIGVELAASRPLDGGSATLYLVPDDGSGGGPGVAGVPTIENGSYVFTSFSGAQVIGTILDSALTTSPSLVSFFVSPAISTPNDEYWVVLDALGTTSVLWSYEFNGTGTGTANQAFFNNYAGSNLQPVPDGDGPYEMIVGTPEPSAMAVLGVGLLGLGWLRRR